MEMSLVTGYALSFLYNLIHCHCCYRVDLASRNSRESLHLVHVIYVIDLIREALHP